MFINKQSYRLKFSFNMRKIHNVFHVFLLKSCKKLAKKKHASFIYVNDEKQYKIKHIFNSQKYYDKL